MKQTNVLTDKIKKKQQYLAKMCTPVNKNQLLKNVRL